MNGKDNMGFDSEGGPSTLHPQVSENNGDLKAKKHDPYALTDDMDFDKSPWSDKTTKEKLKTAAIGFTKFIFVLVFLYLFICSLGLMGSAFQVLAGKTAGDIFSQNEIMSNPITGLIIGILVTVLVQSSSTSTSIFVTMAAAGLIEVRTGVPLIMGANIGTSVTNTIVSLGQSGKREEFRKAFAGATVHDIFNLLSVLVLLPIELISGYLRHLADAIVGDFGTVDKGKKLPDMLKVITKPLTSKIISVNKTVIKNIVKDIDETDSSMVTMWCKRSPRIEAVNTSILYYNDTEVQKLPANVSSNSSDVFTQWEERNRTIKLGLCQTSDFLFANTGMTDGGVGAILLIISLVAMCICLTGMVKLLTSLLKGNLARIIKKVINAKFKKPFGWVTGYLSILVGAGLTIIVQSSSVFTSSITPLVGIGVISLNRMFPLTLGSNIGTTTTGLLAAFASSGDKVNNALKLAICHLFFNISGIIIWYPIPVVRAIPINAAKALGNKTAKHRWFAVAYLIIVFFIIPAILLGLSLAHEWALWSVLILLGLIFIPVVIISCIQSRKPGALPEKLRTWDVLPEALHSLKPYDAWCNKICAPCMRASNKLRQKSTRNREQDPTDIAIRAQPNGKHNDGYLDDVAVDQSKL